MLQQALEVGFFLSGISLFGTDYSVHTTNSSEVTVWKKILTVAFLMSQKEQYLHQPPLFSC
jgi:hypothetical protein